MTVCIASASHPQRAIVAVADSMITVGQGEITADDAAMKHHVIHRDWFGMFAGDVGPAGPILRRAARMLEAADTHTIDAVRSAVTAAYEQERMAQAEASVLGVYGLSMSEFTSSGLARFGPQTFKKLCKRIEMTALGCDFMICGFDQEFDPNGYPQVFAVTNGVANDVFPMGWWAVGSGATNAIGVLAQWRHNFGADMPTTLYRLLEARFAAEAAIGVGDARTFAIIQRYRQPFIMIDEQTVGKIRDIWKTKMRIIPQESMELLRDSIKAFVKKGD